MGVGRPSKLPGILGNKKLIDKLHKMAESGDGLCAFYVAMGINKDTASDWRNPESPRYSAEFSALIKDLYVKSQAWWEALGKDCLKWDKFQATVYNRQMQGRFKDDWSPHTTTDITTQGQAIRPKDATTALLSKIPQDVLEAALREAQE